MLQESRMTRQAMSVRGADPLPCPDLRRNSTNSWESIYDMPPLTEAQGKLNGRTPRPMRDVRRLERRSLLRAPALMLLCSTQ
jgi:hypothetical protein